VSFFDDVWNTVKSVTGGAVDVASDVFDALPVSGPIKDLVNGPLRDFARTPFGATVLRSIASVMFGPIAGVVGAQLASVSWAVPGLLRGEPFDEAWMLEFKWRMEKTAEYLGPGIADTFGAELKRAIDSLSGIYGVGELIELTAEQLAQRLGIRVDVADAVLSLWNRTPPAARGTFDPATGQRKPFSPFGTLADARARDFGLAGQKVSAGMSLADARAKDQIINTMTIARGEPVIASSGATTSSRASTKNDLLLAATIVAAAGAVLWWHREETKKKRSR
jgi:hypothetical protein